jgi:hypothetical protein
MYELSVEADHGKHNSFRNRKHHDMCVVKSFIKRFIFGVRQWCYLIFIGCRKKFYKIDITTASSLSRSPTQTLIVYSLLATRLHPPVLASFQRNHSSKICVTRLHLSLPARVTEHTHIVLLPQAPADQNNQSI